MTLQQVANEAMDYLDSVGVAADYYIDDSSLSIKTDHHFFLGLTECGDYNAALEEIKNKYPQKSPA